MDVYSARHPNNRIHTLSNRRRNLCQERAYLNRLSYVKANLNSLKIIEIIQSVFSNCNKIKLEIRKREIAEKSPNVRKLKTHF